MPTPRLDHRIAHGTARNPLGLALADPHITCADGFCLSVLAPDPSDVFLLPALTLEVGFPTRRPNRGPAGATTSSPARRRATPPNPCS
ncbi:hypothetical protein P3T27_005869 [Kitasatospora sp. MAA19]|uniref:hypothetical protein n=1 Tax=unclassified Kitasatospora TaxID=2633591 RepID=UPI002475C0AE|nr:hypothetical protein [Kitasatospora sp. MAA19]MDH6709123.1 hypothetical protein [Kitasatospora sp. MAA19]